VDENGNPVDANGYPLDENGNPIMQDQGQDGAVVYVDENGNVLENVGPDGMLPIHCAAALSLCVSVVVSLF
jgi:S-adenosylmethionine hydrolase